jgi:putrescine transport system substrate-binding protein
MMGASTMVIPSGAPRPNNAHLFIHYILRPEVHASLSNQVLYANPTMEARKFVVPEVANNPAVFPTPAQLATMVPPAPMTNDTQRLQTRVFTAFKTGR